MTDAIDALRREVRRAALLSVAHRIQEESVRRGDFKSDATSAREAITLYREVEKAEEAK